MAKSASAPLILASTSRHRRALLERLHVAFRVEAPRVDEDALRDPAQAPREQALALARAKAADVAARHPGAVVLGSDQVCALGTEILHKPGTAARAAAQLERLQGRAHDLWTAVAVHHPEGELTHVDHSRLTMRAFTPEQCARYVARDAPLDCAGSYRLEAHGIALFEAIESEDHSGITGLPLLFVVRALAQLGFTLP